MATPEAAWAQATTPEKPGFEFRASSGTVVPTGAQDETMTRGNLSAVQLSYALRPAFAIASTLGWARSRGVSVVGEPKLDVFMYDLGAELRAPAGPRDRSFRFRPFAGFGAGARSYNYRQPDIHATHQAAGYVGGGAEIGIRRVNLRLEVRDYMTGFTRTDAAGNRDLRNDVTVLAGLRFGL